MSGQNLINVSPDTNLDQLLSEKRGELVVLLFWADWSNPCKQMIQVIDALANDRPNVCFMKIEAEQCPDITEKYPMISSVPTTLFLVNGKVVGCVAGAQVPQVVAQVDQWSKKLKLSKQKMAERKASAVESEESLNARLAKLVRMSPVVLFMKGDPSNPKCGFSNKIVRLLSEYENCKFAYFDILTDAQVREGLKKFSNWPTFPQLYIKGELVGGLDVVRELHEEGELEDMLPKPSGENMDDRLKKTYF